MKFALAVLACVAVVGFNAASISEDKTFVFDKAYLEKQKFLFEILYRVEDPLQFEEYIPLGGDLIIDTAKYQKYDESMIHFYNTYKIGGLVPKGEYFITVHKDHALQGQGLFKYFYYAKDYDTLVKNIVWARINVNEGMFVYALTLAVMHRPDMKGLVLPSIFEIFPQSFFNSKFIYQAEKFDSDAYNRQILLEKELKTIYHKDDTVKGSKHCHHFYLKDWKTWQWWKLMGLDDGFQQEEKYFTNVDIQNLVNDPKYQQVLNDVKAYYLPVDYTRDIGIFNQESKLSYFTEDVNLNSYWYYLNIDYAITHESEDRRGEYWIYNVQQILARYYMERLSHGMETIDELAFSSNVEVGYNPQLIAYNGKTFTTRNNNYEVEYNAEVAEYYRRIIDAIESGKIVTKDGVEIDLTKPESIEVIGNLVHGNNDIINKSNVGFWYNIANMYSNGDKLNYLDVQPNVLQNYETMLRDPLTYQLFRKIVDVYYRFKNKLPAYTKEQLIVPGVKIENVEVSELKTYFDLGDYDVTNLLNEKMDFVDGKFVWDKTLLARQIRLNHLPYNYNIKVKSEQPRKIVVRTYLTPEFDQYDRKIDMFSHNENFMQLDMFNYDLPAGETVIKRSSNDSTSDNTSYTELYKYIMLAHEGQLKSLKISGGRCEFPKRLSLPRGWVEGMPMKLVFVITVNNVKQEHVPTNDHTNVCGIGSGSARYIDNLPLGYPFDRKIEDPRSVFMVPNMYYKDVKIYHINKLDKYYPLKYENYGNFDRNF